MVERDRVTVGSVEQAAVSPALLGVVAKAVGLMADKGVPMVLQQAKASKPILTYPTREFADCATFNALIMPVRLSS